MQHSNLMGEVVKSFTNRLCDCLQEIADQSAVPLAELLGALTLPANTNPATEVKSLVADGTVAEVTAVREAVRGLQGK